MITSLLENDAYKFSMQQAFFLLYPEADAEYVFINRDNTPFPDGFAEKLKRELMRLSDLSFRPDEIEWLKKMPWFKRNYLDWLPCFHLDYSQLKIDQPGKKLDVSIKGPIYSAMMWEMPILATISELYYRTIGQKNAELDMFHAKETARKLVEIGIPFADFGLRRRFSSEWHNTVVFICKNEAGSNFIGTSNCFLAKKYNLKSIGTQAHEWIMFHAAKYGYRSANIMAMEKWIDVYQGELGIALTDTFTTDAFLQAFNFKYANLFKGVRQDSGYPDKFTKQMWDHYVKLGIDPRTKTIIYSDALNVEKVAKIQNWRKENNCPIQALLGIGTFVTCNVQGVKPLNIVIKMSQASPEGKDWVPVCKLSDDKGKNTGRPEAVKLCKETLEIE